jgi:hypothetical protein
MAGAIEFVNAHLGDELEQEGTGARPLARVQ